MHVQALYIGEVRLVVVDFDWQNNGVAIAIKVGGYDFEIQCEAIASKRMINRSLAASMKLKSSTRRGFPPNR